MGGGGGGDIANLNLTCQTPDPVADLAIAVRILHVIRRPPKLANAPWDCSEVDTADAEISPPPKQPKKTSL